MSAAVHWTSAPLASERATAVVDGVDVVVDRLPDGRCYWGATVVDYDGGRYVSRYGSAPTREEAVARAEAAAASVRRGFDAMGGAS